MKVNKLVIILILVAIIGFGVVYLLDPNNNVVTIDVSMSLAPGENFTVIMPLSTLLGAVSELLSDPYLWVETNAEGIVLDGVGELLPERILGIMELLGEDQEGNTEELVFINTGNETSEGRVNCVRASPPDRASKVAAWLNRGLCIFELLIASLIVYIKPTPTVNVRPAAKGSIGQTTSSFEEKGKCWWIRDKTVVLLRSCCLRGGPSALPL